MTALRARIDARRAVVVERLAIAEAAGGVTWDDVENDAGAVLIHIAANDPATIIAECRRELAAIDADLALLDAAEDWHQEPGEGRSLGAVAVLLNGVSATNLAARYPEASS